MNTTEQIRGKILWADDEIDLLRSHVMFLEGKGFQVTTVTNGDDAIALCQNDRFDIVLLDETMPGKDGLETLSILKAEFPALPIIMITKNEEEKLMEEAIGSKISDYLTKPVNPSQILLAIIKILENRQIKQDAVSGQYMSAFADLAFNIEDNPGPQDWINIHNQLSAWELELDDYPDLGFDEMLLQQQHEANDRFTRFVKSNYENWVNVSADKRPTLSPDVFSTSVKPLLEQDKKVLMLIIDCMRWDQWLTLEPLLYNDYQIKRDGYFSLLPTTTEYSRNAIFSGLFPDDMQRFHPEWWGGTDEHSLNRHEAAFLQENIKRSGLELKPEAKYKKIITNREGIQFGKQFGSWGSQKLVTLVVNQVDLLAHRRTDSPLLRELLPNEASYREIVRAWFNNSWIKEVLSSAAKMGFHVIITSDHGSVRVQQPTQILADREASTNLRFKQGRNLKPSTKDAWFLDKPGRLRIPSTIQNDTLAIAQKMYYFLYPNNYRKYQNKFADTYQHGGLSMWEMIIPLAHLEPK
ncbi:MAG: response regulator [Candidatus Marinimicrobia bacterium]|jgi:CheY-like chemotaxis protein|nr:response regulator [Candidatus Neomarinimicrobiota bacterium]MBT3576608.1 response regulator [Candidatus Neomarinimicrobiota bacterium]MBT3680246.1 response regulator [Candidatus Neomarinimicrobiota bacterium]MBT3950376.1 response regulator [Candidatus Neomarinimicrobiota bacterium]MBT4253633.1 response regulator [Candidatus Neomarinimicrobiota bacterium]